MPGGDGTGPRKGSRQASMTGGIGKRVLAGKKCPAKKKRK